MSILEEIEMVPGPGPGTDDGEATPAVNDDGPDEMPSEYDDFDAPPPPPVAPPPPSAPPGAGGPLPD